jgi:hypothetical protein
MNRESGDNRDSRARERDRGFDDPQDYPPQRYNNRAWIAPTIIALGTFLASAAAAWTSIVANGNAYDAKVQSEQTGKRVDGRMEEMLALARAAAATQATLDEKAAQRAREANEAIASAKPAKPANDELTAAAAQAVLDLAAVRAKKLLADAAIEAEKLRTKELERK